jgi:hypothetical protein
VGRVVGNLLGRSIGFGFGHNLKGFHLGQFIPKPKSKETMEVFEATGPVSDPKVGSVSGKDFQRSETMSAMAQGGLHLPESISIVLTRSEKAEVVDASPVCYFGRFALSSSASGGLADLAVESGLC